MDALIASGQDIGAFEGGRLAGQLQLGVDAADVRADIVGVNALGNVLTEKTVPRYVDSGTHAGRRKILVEGANLAETAGGAKKIDAARDALLVVTGDLANLGGVHVSNLEGVQNRTGQAVSNEAARRSLQSTMRSGWRRAMAIADQRGLSERAAIELAAVDAMMKRSLQLPDAPKSSLEARVLGKRPPRVARVVARPRPAAGKGRSAMIRRMRTAPRTGRGASAVRTRTSGATSARTTRVQRTAVRRTATRRQR